MRLTISRFRLIAVFSVAVMSIGVVHSQSNRTLDFYFIDVEGGQSTLFVTPTGKSLLIDTGWPDNNFRDADRIAAAAKSAGLKIA